MEETSFDIQEEKNKPLNSVRSYLNRKIVLKDFLIATMIFLAFIIFTSIFLIDQLKKGFIENYSVIFGSLIQVTGGLLGFVVTGFSILTVASNKKYLKEYKKSGLLEELVIIFKVTIYLLGIDTLIFIIILLINTPDNLILLGISLWLIILSAFYLYRCIQVMVKLSTINILH